MVGSVWIVASGEREARCDVDISDWCQVGHEAASGDDVADKSFERRHGGAIQRAPQADAAHADSAASATVMVLPMPMSMPMPIRVFTGPPTSATMVRSETRSFGPVRTGNLRRLQRRLEDGRSTHAADRRSREGRLRSRVVGSLTVYVTNIQRPLISAVASSAYGP